MKVIFLNIDGVLNSAQFRAEIQDRRLTMPKIEREIDKKSLLMLKRIIDETGARIVVTSSMRKEPTFKDFKEYVSHEGIKIHDVTLDFGDAGMHRGEEIREWMQKHEEELEEYVILDDDTFKDFGEELKAHQVKPSMWTTRGLEQTHADQAITLLGKLKEPIRIITITEFYNDIPTKCRGAHSASALRSPNSIIKIKKET